MSALASEPGAFDDGAYLHHLLAAASALYTAARADDAIDLVDLDVVLTGRRALLDTLTAVHTELTGHRATLRPIHPHDIEGHPVHALGQALHRCPRPPGLLSPTDVVLSEPVSPYGRAWQAVARHATIAHHIWTTGDGDRLDPQTQWAGIADVATTAAVLARLDVGLVVATARERGLSRITRDLRGGLNLGLGLAARETLRLASAGPMPTTGPERTARPPLQVLPVSTAAELPQAQARLAALLRHGGPLRPERLPALAGLQARACLHLATAMRAATHTPVDGIDVHALSAGLLRHAEALRAATVRRNAIASVVPGDGRPLRQAADIDQVLAREANRVSSDPRLLAEVVSGIAADTAALSSAAGRALESGAWMVPDFSTSIDRPLWHVWRSPDPVPSSVTAVRRSAAHASELSRLVAPAAPSPPTADRPLRLDRSRAVTTSRDLVALAVKRPRTPGYPPLPAVARRR